MAAVAARPVRSSVTWLVVVAAFAIGAGAGFAGSRLAPPTPGAAPDAIDARRAGAAPATDDALSDRMLALDPFLVNLAGEDAARYLKVKVELETESAARRQELASRLPQLRDGVIAVLSARDVADVTSLEGKTLLKQDVQDRVNGLLPGGGVRSVLFTEFVVQ
jgi:flagellar FliL protein